MDNGDTERKMLTEDHYVDRAGRWRNAGLWKLENVGSYWLVILVFLC